MGTRWRLFSSVVLFLLAAGSADLGFASAQPSCDLALRFKALRDEVIEPVEACLESKPFGVANGNDEQRATGGLLAWWKSVSWATLTDGDTILIHRPSGAVSRLHTGSPLVSEIASADGE